MGKRRMITKTRSLMKMRKLRRSSRLLKTRFLTKYPR